MSPLPHPTAATQLEARIRASIASSGTPIVVGIDGRSGAGKSTVAAAVATALAGTGGSGTEVTVIEGDTFYAGGSAEHWDRRTAAEKMDLVIDWRRQESVLAELLRTGTAQWHPFDWDADGWDRDPAPLAPTPIVAHLAPVVLLEGAYSCRPELHHLLDLLVLLEVPADLRRRQLMSREGSEYRSDWDARWSDAEDHYFGSVMPPDRFDLVLG